MKKSNLVLLLAALLVLSVSALEIAANRCARRLEVVHYQVSTDLSQTLRIVQLTDLHGREHPSGNEALARLVAEQSPDLIVMTGDMLDESDENADVVCDLIRLLAPVAPVYYGYGNHEMAWMETHGEILRSALTEAGAVVLNVEFLDVTLKGQELRIGGYYNYYRQPHMFPVTAAEKAAEFAFADAMEGTDRYSILLSHIPTAWIDWGYIDKFPMDLVLTGHYHGGQIRLPGLGGLYAPYIGFFPEYTEGIFVGEKATAILSTGLGTSRGVPRIQNPPQITLVELVPKSQN